MPAITLTTDWGVTDHYVAALKGELLSLFPGAALVDISHQVPPYDVMRAAFVFKNSYYFFPAGTIHLVSVGAQTSRSTEWMVIQDSDCFIVCRNDGFFTLVTGRQPQKAVVIKSSEKISVADERSFLVTILNDLLEKKSLDSIGESIDAIKERSFLSPTLEENLIRGTVIHIDVFGNAVTNIDRELFDREGRNRDFEIDFPRRDVVIRKLSNHYNDVERGQLLVLFNSSGYLEIAQNQGDASGLYGLEYGDQIRISFK
jgi:hypothetical protein